MERRLKAIVYSRVSTDAQERDGTSLDTQERASHEYVESNGWVLVESIRDTSSGSTLDRPGIERLRTLIRQSSVDVVVAYAVVMCLHVLCEGIGDVSCLVELVLVFGASNVFEDLGLSVSKRRVLVFEALPFFL